MKTLKTITPILLLLFAIFIIGESCMTPVAEPESEEDNQCEYEGLKFDDNANNIHILIPENELTTDFFHTSSNGPEVEIYKTAAPGDMNFVTTVVAQGASGTGILHINGNTYNVDVTCEKTGSAVGEEMRFKMSNASGIEAKFCVMIDQYH